MESKFLNSLSAKASFVKSKCRALHNYQLYTHNNFLNALNCILKKVQLHVTFDFSPLWLTPGPSCLYRLKTDNAEFDYYYPLDK